MSNATPPHNVDDLLALAALPPRPAWMQRASCRNLDTAQFFPTRGQRHDHVLAICETCEVRTDCLDYSIDNLEMFGIWGGQTGRARRIIRSQRRLQRSIDRDSDEPTRGVG